MADIRAENADLATIEVQAGNIWPIGYLVTALLGSGDVGEEQAYSIHDITRKHVPSLTAEARAARAVIEAVRTHGHEGWRECPCCYSLDSVRKPLVHEPDCPLVAYDALRAKQGGK